MNKSSPNKTALIIALTATGLFLLFSFVLVEHFSAHASQLIAGLIFFILIFTLTFFLIKLLLTDKLRGIYAAIRNLSPGRVKRVKISMNDDVITKTERDVKDWASMRKKEIEKLKEQEKFRREFIGNLSHELKTPLFNIQGYILTLLEGGLEDDSINRKFLEKAANSVDRLTDMVNDLDAIAKMESMALNLDVKAFSLLELAEETVEELKLIAEEKNISIDFDKLYENPFIVMGDRSKIQQVISNLTINAINYGKENGNIILSLNKSGYKVILTVKDDGIGIKEEELTRIFERFYRVEKSRSSNVKGTGLGLAIVKHILDAHGENIRVQSESGKGSAFSFSLRKGN